MDCARLAPAVRQRQWPPWYHGQRKYGQGDPWLSMAIPPGPLKMKSMASESGTMNAVCLVVDAAVTQRQNKPSIPPDTQAPGWIGYSQALKNITASIIIASTGLRSMMALKNRIEPEGKPGR